MYILHYFDKIEKVNVKNKKMKTICVMSNAKWHISYV